MRLEQGPEEQILVQGGTVISSFTGMKEEKIGVDFSNFYGCEGRKLKHQLIYTGTFFVLMNRN